VEVVAIVLSVLLAVAAIYDSIPKVRLEEEIVTLLRQRGISRNAVRALGVGVLVAGVGLIAGIFFTYIGIAACVLLVGLFTFRFWSQFMYGDFTGPSPNKRAYFTLSILLSTILTGGALMVTL
jgi:hypothetical protein